MSLACPLCSLPLTAATLEAHLRQELTYPSLRCQLCRFDFHSEERAAEHFRGPLAKHPGQPLKVSYLEKDLVKEARLVELVRLAEGGQRAVEERLCVCGQCRLLCREDFRLTSRSARKFASSLPQETLDPVSSHDYPEPEANWTNFKAADSAQKGSDEEFGHPEASQEEEQMMPVDVKPDLSDLKPQINKDGKVACIQCGLRVDKAWFKQHAVGAHSTARPFSCSLCPHNEKTRGALAKHQKKDHGTELSDETFIFAGSEEKIREVIEQCFGSAKDTEWAKLRCQPCDKLIITKNLKRHIAKNHIKKPLHACKLCTYSSAEPSAYAVNAHVKKVHKLQPSPDNVDSSQARHYGPIIQNMIPQLFTKE